MQVSLLPAVVLVGILTVPTNDQFAPPRHPSRRERTERSELIATRAL